MKTAKKLIAMLLMLMLVFSLTSPAFAAGTEEPRYKNYFMIGDSVAIKCRSDRSDKSGYLHFSEDSYSELVAKHYNIPSGYCCAYTGWRTQEALIPIDPSYDGDIYTTDWQPRWGVEGNLALMQSMRATAIPALENADLITVNLGSNNIIGTLAYSLAKVFEDETAGTKWERQAIQAINEAIKESSDIVVLAKILEAAKLMGQVKIVLETGIKDLANALAAFPASWDRLIARIRAVNPTATMVVIGMYNAIGGNIRYLAEEYGIDPELIGLLADALNEMTMPPVQVINCAMKNSVYRNEYIYVDNTEVDLHDTPDGHHMGPTAHANVADRIIAALDKSYEASICTHPNAGLTNVRAATKLCKGYSGDLVCPDCGQMLEKGHATTFVCAHANTKLVGMIPSTHFTLGFSGSVFCADCGKLLELGHITPLKSWR